MSCTGRHNRGTTTAGLVYSSSHKEIVQESLLKLNCMLDKYAHMVAIHFMFYNYARIHKTLRVTPVMEAGLANHVWSLEEIIELTN